MLARRGRQRAVREVQADEVLVNLVFVRDGVHVVGYGDTTLQTQLVQLLRESRHQLVVCCRKGATQVITLNSDLVDVWVHEAREEHQRCKLVLQVVVFEDDVLEARQDRYR